MFDAIQSSLKYLFKGNVNKEIAGLKTDVSFKGVITDKRWDNYFIRKLQTERAQYLLKHTGILNLRTLTGYMHGCCLKIGFTLM